MEVVQGPLGEPSRVGSLKPARSFGTLLTVLGFAFPIARLGFILSLNQTHTHTHAHTSGMHGIFQGAASAWSISVLQRARVTTALPASSNQPVPANVYCDRLSKMSWPARKVGTRSCFRPGEICYAHRGINGIK